MYNFVHNNEKKNAWKEWEKIIVTKYFLCRSTFLKDVLFQKSEKKINNNKKILCDIFSLFASKKKMAGKWKLIYVFFQMYIQSSCTCVLVKFCTVPPFLFLNMCVYVKCGDKPRSKYVSNHFFLTEMDYRKMRKFKKLRRVIFSILYLQ
jgi:hypothetical protein